MRLLCWDELNYYCYYWYDEWSDGVWAGVCCLISLGYEFVLLILYMLFYSSIILLLKLFFKLFFIFFILLLGVLINEDYEG